MNDTLTKESPCVIQMIEDIKRVYKEMDESSVEVYFLSRDKKFIIEKNTYFQVPTGDGGVYWESEPMWVQVYSWSQMTDWFFQNRPFTFDEFKTYNKDKLGEIYIGLSKEELESTTMEQMSRFYFNNRTFGHQKGLAYCCADLEPVV